MQPQVVQYFERNKMNCNEVFAGKTFGIVWCEGRVFVFGKGEFGEVGINKEIGVRNIEEI